MKEYFLHYIWRFRLFSSTEIKTTKGEKIQIHHPGIYNTNGGPDFLNAQISLGDTRWIGHVEIHIRAGDWHKHQHTHDVHYKNVILHVVFENDAEIFLHQPGDLPVLHLSEYFDPALFQKYETWLQTKQWIPCAAQIYAVEEWIINAWKDRMGMERLEEKAERIRVKFEKNDGDWLETFYQLLARNFGFHINGDACEWLAESLPLKLIRRYLDRPLQIEALFFGQAGMLTEMCNTGYPGELRQEYDFLRKKHRLTALNPAIWNFSRIRPANFPTLRIAQFCAILVHSGQSLMRFVQPISKQEIIDLLRREVTNFWKTQYHFFPDKKDAHHAVLPIEKKKSNSFSHSQMGFSAAENCIINTIAPFLVVYGKKNDEMQYIEQALYLLESCSPENHAMIQKWKNLGISVSSAMDTQALLHLFHHYCEKKRCLECRIGLQLIHPDRAV